MGRSQKRGVGVSSQTYSALQASWDVAPAAPAEFLGKFPEYPRPVAQLLFNRSLSDDAAISSFLNPVYTKDLHSPRLLKGMDQAVGVLSAAMASGEPIVVHGDYDADGITATALLCTVLNRLGGQVTPFIPSRYTDGYGVSESTLKRLRSEGAAVVVTVDCGISSREAISAGRKAGLKVVVTDHHLPPAELPDADALINPHQPGDQYPNKVLTGVGVAFKLAQALLRESSLSAAEREVAEKWALDLVALGTVADVASLLGENRTLVKFGLVVLGKTRRPGLRELMKAAQCDPSAVTTSKIGYTLAPRLNAAGRLTHAKHALELLLTDDAERARQLAVELNDLNLKRQAVTAEAFEHAKEVLGQVDDNRRVLIVDGAWVSGIVGLVAGKLSQEYSRPALVIQRGDDVSVGSARSIPALNIVDALAEHKTYLTKFGGHAAAAGFSLPTEKLDDFRAAMESFCAEQLTPEDLRKAIPIESELAEEELDFDLVEQLEQFQPFGIDNPEPQFLLKGFRPESVRIVGRDETHVKLAGQLPGGKRLTALAFGFAPHLRRLREAGSLDMVGAPVTNVFNNTKTLEWHLRDFKGTG